MQTPHCKGTLIPRFFFVLFSDALLWPAFRGRARPAGKGRSHTASFCVLQRAAWVCGGRFKRQCVWWLRMSSDRSFLKATVGCRSQKTHTSETRLHQACVSMSVCAVPREAYAVCALTSARLSVLRSNTRVHTDLPFIDLLKAARVEENEQAELCLTVWNLRLREAVPSVFTVPGPPSPSTDAGTVCFAFAGVCAHVSFSLCKALISSRAVD